MTLPAAAVPIPDRVSSMMHDQTAKEIFRAYYAFPVNTSQTATASYSYYLCVSSSFTESSSMITAESADVFCYYQDTYGNYHRDINYGVPLTITNPDDIIFYSSNSDFPAFESRCDYGTFYLVGLGVFAVMLLLVLRIMSDWRER